MSLLKGLHQTNPLACEGPLKEWGAGICYLCSVREVWYHRRKEQVQDKQDR